MISRRAFLKLSGATMVAGVGLSSYAFAIEPWYRLLVTPYRLTPPGWPDGRRLRIAVIADIHACEPFMPSSRIDRIVGTANDLEPDLIVLLGDYVSGLRRFATGIVPISAWSRVVGRLSAPLGVHSVLGNHDWWTDGPGVWHGLEDSGVRVLENNAVRIAPKDGPAFWLAGLGDQLADRVAGTYEGRDDLPATLAGIPDDGAPVILLAHEPDVFPRVPERVALTLCGHTHGGQVSLPLVGRPVVPSHYGQRYAYGHVVENGRNLIVSGGLGCSGIPVRFGVPPEIVLIELGGAPAAA
ncbi:MAG: metallophosphoesterase [Bauldia sp.]|nr:MAG: metallophosphoesterase [Bauldia sp.]